MFYKADILQGPKDRYPYKKNLDLRVCCPQKTIRKLILFFNDANPFISRKWIPCYTAIFCILSILNQYICT